MEISESLIRFESPAREDKELERQKLEADIQKFLKAGGKIQKLEPWETGIPDEPIKRTRKDQVAWAKRNLREL